MVELLDWAKSAHGNAASTGDDVGPVYSLRKHYVIALVMAVYWYKKVGSVALFRIVHEETAPTVRTLTPYSTRIRYTGA
jgi:hypothetical protein